MRIKYQASFFADLSTLAATPENTVTLLTNLNARGVGLLPSTMHEIAPPNMTPVPRLRFTSPSGDSEVVVGTGRLDVVRQVPIFSGTEIEPFGAFAEFVERCTSAIFQGRTIMGSRLALIVQTITGELPPATLSDHFRKLFTAPTFYTQHPPSEWTFRANSQPNLPFDQFNEPVNTILKTERVQGKATQESGVWQDFDRVISEFDINTRPTDITPRFSPAVLRSFVEAASPMIDSLETDLAAKLA